MPDYLRAFEFGCKTVRSIFTGSGAPTLPGPLDDGDLLAQAEEANEVLEPWWSRCAVEAKAAKTEPRPVTMRRVTDAEELIEEELQITTDGDPAFRRTEAPDAASARVSDRGTPPRGVEEAPRGADSPPVDVDEVVAYRLHCRTCNNQLTGLMPTALRARQAFEEKGSRCRICNPVSVLPDAIGGPW